MAKRRKRYFKGTPKKQRFESKAVVDKPKEEEVKATPRPKRVSRKRTTVKVSRPKVEYREMVYLGTADTSTVVGAVTGRKYSFGKDAYGMPKPTKVDEKDYQGVLALKGKGCSRRDPTALFISKTDWELEIAQAKRVNR